MRVLRLSGGRTAAQAYTPRDTAQYENLVRLAAYQAMGGRDPLAGPVSVEMRAWMPIPASWSLTKRERAARGEILPATKPDLDNTWKAVADAMNGVIYVDDKQIVSATISKVYGLTPAVRVRVVACK